MTSETYNLWSLVVYIASAVIALSMLCIALFQFRKLNSQVVEAVKSNKINELATFLEIENQISNSRRELAIAGVRVKSAESGTDEFDSASLYLNECLENYVNSIDRLCYCIIKEYFNNDEMKIEYRHIINDAVSNNLQAFSQATKHRNIKKIHEKWADS